MKPHSALLLLCGPLIEYDASRTAWDSGAERLTTLYGQDPTRVSAKGRLAWQALATKAINATRSSEALCSPARKALRARLAPKDRASLQPVCIAILGSLRFYRIELKTFAEGRAVNRSEKATIREVLTSFNRNLPRLEAVLRDPSLVSNSS